MVMSAITEDDYILPSHGSPLSKTPVTYTYDFIELTIHHYPSRLFTVLKTDYTFNQFQPNLTDKREFRYYFRIDDFQGTKTDLLFWWHPVPLSFHDPHKAIPKFKIKIVNKLQKLPLTILSDALMFFEILSAAEVPKESVKISSVELSTIINLPHEFVKKHLNIRYSRKVTLEGPKNPNTIYFTQRKNQHGRIYCYPQRDMDGNPESDITKIEVELRGKRRMEQYDLKSIRKLKDWNPLPMLKSRVEFIDVDFAQVEKRNTRQMATYLKSLYRDNYVSSWIRRDVVKETCLNPRGMYTRKVEELEKAYFNGIQSTWEVIRSTPI